MILFFHEQSQTRLTNQQDNTVEPSRAFAVIERSNGTWTSERKQAAIVDPASRDELRSFLRTRSRFSQYIPANRRRRELSRSRLHGDGIIQIE
jgi:hypothetical protein